MASTDLDDLFHAMRLAANGVITDPEEESMSIVENQSLALAKLFEQGFDLLDDPDTAESFVGDRLIHFWRRLLKVPDSMQLKRDEALAGMNPGMTATYSILWSLGYGNDRQEVYDGAMEIATTVAAFCNEVLGTPEPAAAAVKRPPRGTKPTLVHDVTKGG